MNTATTQTRSDKSCGPSPQLSPTSEGKEWIPDLVPRPDGIRFSRGVLLGIVLCIPVWLFVWWLVAHRIL